MSDGNGNDNHDDDGDRELTASEIEERIAAFEMAERIAEAHNDSRVMRRRDIPRRSVLAYQCADGCTCENSPVRDLLDNSENVANREEIVEALLARGRRRFQPAEATDGQPPVNLRDVNRPFTMEELLLAIRSDPGPMCENPFASRNQVREQPNPGNSGINREAGLDATEGAAEPENTIRSNLWNYQPARLVGHTHLGMGDAEPYRIQRSDGSHELVFDYFEDLYLDDDLVYMDELELVESESEEDELGEEEKAEMDRSRAEKKESIRMLIEENKSSNLYSFSRSCPQCKTDEPPFRVVFPACGHAICRPCADGIEFDVENPLFCPLCDEPGGFVTLFENKEEKDDKSAPPTVTRECEICLLVPLQRVFYKKCGHVSCRACAETVALGRWEEGRFDRCSFCREEGDFAYLME